MFQIKRHYDEGQRKEIYYTAQDTLWKEAHLQPISRYRYEL
jgi:hypothetical protein